MMISGPQKLKISITVWERKKTEELLKKGQDNVLYMIPPKKNIYI